MCSHQNLPNIDKQSEFPYDLRFPEHVLPLNSVVWLSRPPFPPPPLSRSLTRPPFPEQPFVQAHALASRPLRPGAHHPGGPRLFAAGWRRANPRGAGVLSWPPFIELPGRATRSLSTLYGAGTKTPKCWPCFRGTGTCRLIRSLPWFPLDNLTLLPVLAKGKLQVPGQGQLWEEIVGERATRAFMPRCYR